MRPAGRSNVLQRILGGRRKTRGHSGVFWGPPTNLCNIVNKYKYIWRSALKKCGCGCSMLCLSGLAIAYCERGLAVAHSVARRMSRIVSYPAATAGGTPCTVQTPGGTSCTVQLQLGARHAPCRQLGARHARCSYSWGHVMHHAATAGGTSCTVQLQPRACHVRWACHGPASAAAGGALCLLGHLQGPQSTIA